MEQYGHMIVLSDFIPHMDLDPELSHQDNMLIPALSLLSHMPAPYPIPICAAINLFSSSIIFFVIK